jgi:hypothetical protein
MACSRYLPQGERYDPDFLWRRFWRRIVEELCRIASFFGFMLAMNCSVEPVINSAFVGMSISPNVQTRSGEGIAHGDCVTL